uniref:SAP30-binding protein n=1 Tax=Arion vulgaris TaxID=1028688 RepID=A0A0B6Y7J1_9EUPU
MMRNDSASVISSLQMHYGDSDDEESEKRNTSSSDIVEELPFINSENDNPLSEIVKSPVAIEKYSYTSSFDKDEASENMNSEDIDDLDRETEITSGQLISDDEDGEHPHHRRHPQPDLEAIRRQAVIDAVKTASPSSQGSINPGKKAARLVSYGPDDDVDEDDSSDFEVKDFSEDSTTATPEHAVDASTLSRSVQNMASDKIKIPIEPIGKCSYQLQKKIDDMYERMRREGLDLNRAIQSKKNFRNPSIYEKLIDYCHIDEKGTNFPPEIYDPSIWGKDSFYDELDKVQRKEMERREKEKKTKIEFLVGTKKPATSADGAMGPSDEKKRKTKWDAQPAAMIHVSKLPSANQNPGVVNLTAMATGTKATVISAVGSLSKKPSSGK